MRIRSLLLSGLVLASGLAAPSAPAQAKDTKAAAVADRVMQALGGVDAWNKTRYLRFDFAVDRGGKTVMRRAHTWDKWTGRYRLEATTRDGEAYVVLLDLNTRAGRAWLKGTEQQQSSSGDEQKKDQDKGGGGIQSNLPQEGKGEGQQNQGGGSDSGPVAVGDVDVRRGPRRAVVCVQRVREPARPLL